MDFKDLEKHHQQGLVAYWKARDKALDKLLSDQAVILDHCTLSGPEGNHLIKKLFEQQRNTLEQEQKDVLDMLLHMQALEREEFQKKEQIKQSLQSLLYADPENRRGRGR